MSVNVSGDDKDVRAEEHRLKSEKGNLEQRRKELQSRINQIDARLLEIKWSMYPIGKNVEDERGYKYIVGGYATYWILGYKIKKDGTPYANMTPIYNVKKESLPLTPDRDTLETPE